MLHAFGANYTPVTAASN